VFDKLDGTNMHWVWSSEKGFYAFGLRRRRYQLDSLGKQEFSKTHPELVESLGLFHDLQEELLAIAKRLCSTELIVFTEFFGDQTFAGQHIKDDPKKLVAIDVSVDGELLEPYAFIDAFKSLPTPRVLFEGKMNGGLADSIRGGIYDVSEGVVVKGIGKRGEVWMAKIKTDKYMARLKDEHGPKWQEYWE
jgi:hypothetical protein